MSSVSEILAGYYLHDLKVESGVTGINGITPENVVKMLSEAYRNWTWEVVSDKFMDNNQGVIEVRVFIPGRVLYGRVSYNTQDMNTAHFKAIAEACKSLEFNQSILPNMGPETLFNNNKRTEEPKVEQPPVQSQPIQPTQTAKPIQGDVMSNDEIMNLVMQNNAKVQQPTPAPMESKMIESLEQLQNDPREEIPMEEISDACFNQMAPAPAPQPIQQGQKPVDPKKAFSQEQIAAILQIKKDFNITNDEMFGNYINSWNPKLSHKGDLTIDNIDSFIQWARTLGECPC